MKSVTETPARWRRQIPTAAPAAIPPQMPSPPSQTAIGPYQVWGISLKLVMSK